MAPAAPRLHRHYCFFPRFPLYLGSCATQARSLSCSALKHSQHQDSGGGSKNFKYVRKPSKYWDDFYKRHHNKFFKDRHYLEKDWGHYFAASPSGESDGTSANPKVVLEVGCGAGNTLFPLLAAFPTVFVHACDFSPHAIALVKIFMLSAVFPVKMPLVLQNIKNVLKPTGYVLFRDYAMGDFAQEKLDTKDRMISNNFYVRGDGTCAFYFSEDSLRALFEENGFRTLDANVYCKQIVNHSRKVVMDRRWIRGAFCNIDHADSHQI